MDKRKKKLSRLIEYRNSLEDILERTEDKCKIKRIESFIKYSNNQIRNLKYELGV